MYMLAARLVQHIQMDRRNRTTEMRLQHNDVEIAHRLGNIEFSLYDKEGDSLVEGAAQLKYLGRTLEQIENDFPSIR